MTINRPLRVCQFSKVADKTATVPASIRSHVRALWGTHNALFQGHHICPTKLAVSFLVAPPPGAVEAPPGRTHLVVICRADVGVAYERKDENRGMITATEVTDFGISSLLPTISTLFSVPEAIISVSLYVSRYIYLCALDWTSQWHFPTPRTVALVARIEGI